MCQVPRGFRHSDMSRHVSQVGMTRDRADTVTYEEGTRSEWTLYKSHLCQDILRLTVLTAAAGCWLLAGVWKCGETFRECWDSEHGTLQPGHSKLGHLNILHEDKHCLKIQVLLIQMEVCGKHCTVE